MGSLGGLGERQTPGRLAEDSVGDRTGAVLEEGSWAQVLWKPRLYSWVTGTMLRSHLCFRNIFLEALWRVHWRRQAGSSAIVNWLLPCSGTE